MDLQISGKRALVTGGSKGIGKAVAEVLAAEGCDLVLVARDAAALAETARTIRTKNQVAVETIAADLSNDAAVASVARQVGAVDILVNNAGAIPPGTLADVDDTTWRKAWDLKVYGFISMCREIYPAMAARKSGVIINIIGAAGERHPSAYIAGSAGNAALMGFTKALAHGAHADGIRVVGINPGAILTERAIMLARTKAEAQWGDAERWPDLHKSLPFGRAGRPEEVAHTVAFFASPLSSYTSGTILTIDGGKE
ncbi:MAG: short-chain dehydrogenase [Rhodospirillaceae bacterium]|nr:short-chain dehydrogenase [Magnetovibrio sp.]MAY68511.1 short-chain dehydrogenase [Rhodospirillaceae bacterium]